MSFEGQVAIVTGAASGIGRATASLLAKAGARVVVADVNEERGNTVAQDIRSTGGEAVFHRVDLTSLPEIQALAAPVTMATCPSNDMMFLPKGRVAPAGRLPGGSAEGYSTWRLPPMVVFSTRPPSIMCRKGLPFSAAC